MAEQEKLNRIEAAARRIEEDLEPGKRPLPSYDQIADMLEKGRKRLNDATAELKEADRIKGWLQTAKKACEEAQKREKTVPTVKAEVATLLDEVNNLMAGVPKAAPTGGASGGAGEQPPTT